jgi:hypothetical protein
LLLSARSRKIEAACNLICESDVHHFSRVFLIYSQLACLLCALSYLQRAADTLIPRTVFNLCVTQSRFL